MDAILCRKCDTGNPVYLRYCANCNADLFEQQEEEPKVDNVDPAKLRRMATIAVVASVLTTAFKIWMLYGLEHEAHLAFPQLRDIFAIGIVPVAAAIAAAKYRRWYWVLLIDSALMLPIILVVGGIMVMSMFRK